MPQPTAPMAAPLSDFTGCILAGGLGTRLRSCVADRPKVMAPVGGRPFLDYVLCQFERCGIPRTVICTGYLAGAIEEHYGAQFGNMELVYSREGQPLGTGGALRLALPLLSGGVTVVANGDSYFDLDLRGIAPQFRESKAAALLLLRQVPDAGRYGRVEFGSDGKINRFCEKNAVAGAGTINAGIYFFTPEVIPQIPSGTAFSLERELFPCLASERRLVGSICEGVFIDIGVPESYRLAQSLSASFGFVRRPD